LSRVDTAAEEISIQSVFHAAVRIMDVRKAYASTDFEWDNLQRVCLEEIRKENVGVMRHHISSRYNTSSALEQQHREDEDGSSAAQGKGE